MPIHFDPNRVARYVQKRDNNQEKQGIKAKPVASNFSNAVLAFFDRNADGIVTNREFFAHDKSKYDRYMAQLSQYIEEHPEYDDAWAPESEIRDYDSMLNLFNGKGYFVVNEISNGANNSASRLNTDMTIPEQRHKKNPDDLSAAERAEELNYSNGGVSIPILRQQINIFDENSNVVDHHIGTFNQNGLMTCTMLATLNLKSDDDLRELYQEKTDRNGETYYEVNFPNDDNKKTIKIYQRDLDNKYIDIGRGEIVKGFSQGDADVMLVEKAYIKRYGASIINGGSTREEAMNRLFKGANAISGTPTEEALQNGKPTTTGAMRIEELKEKYYDEEKQCLILPNGQEIRIGQKEATDGTHTTLILPNGVEIYGAHANSVSSYNPDTKEVFITNPLESSTDLPVPFEIFQYLFTITQ